jgi:hypothetical protein
MFLLIVFQQDYLLKPFYLVSVTWMSDGHTDQLYFSSVVTMMI